MGKICRAKEIFYLFSQYSNGRNENSIEFGQEKIISLGNFKPLPLWVADK